MRQAGRAVVAVGFAAALGRVQPVFGGGDDLGDVDACRRCGEDVAAAGPAQAFNKSGAAEFAEQLLEIGEGYVLAFADGTEFDGAGLRVHRQIQHSGNGETPFGGQSHGGGCPCRLFL